MLPQFLGPLVFQVHLERLVHPNKETRTEAVHRHLRSFIALGGCHPRNQKATSVCLGMILHTLKKSFATVTCGQDCDKLSPYANGIANS